MYRQGQYWIDAKALRHIADDEFGRDTDTPHLMGDETKNDADQCGLTGAVGSYQAYDLTAGNFEIDAG